MSDADKEKYKAENSKVEFIPVSPDKKEGCGSIIMRMWVPNNSCCDEITPIEWDQENSATTIGPNSQALVAVLNGVPPFKWKINGQGFFLSELGAKSITTNARTVRVFTKNACGGGEITVTDPCSDTQGGVRCTAGKWEYQTRCSTSNCAVPNGWESELNFESVSSLYKYAWITSAVCFDRTLGVSDCGAVVRPGEITGITSGSHTCVTSFINNPLCTADCRSCIKDKITYKWVC